MMQILVEMHVHDDLFLIHGQIVYVRFDSMVASCAEFACQGQWFGGSVCSYVFCFVLLCFAWPFMLVRKARLLFSGRVFSRKVYCLLFLMYFKFRCSMCGMFFGSHSCMILCLPSVVCVMLLSFFGAAR